MLCGYCDDVFKFHWPRSLTGGCCFFGPAFAFRVQNLLIKDRVTLKFLLKFSGFRYMETQTCTELRPLAAVFEKTVNQTGVFPMFTQKGPIL